MKTTTVLVNPAAGGGRAGRIWERLLAAEPALADAHEIRTTDAEAGRVELARRLAAGTQRVLSVGGDGTAHLVVNAVLEAGRGEDVAIGLVPAGTGTDLARGLGLPLDPRAALRRVLAAEPRPLDALRLEVEGGERRFAVNCVAAGMAGALVPAGRATDRLMCQIWLLLIV